MYIFANGRTAAWVLAVRSLLTWSVLEPACGRTERTKVGDEQAPELPQNTGRGGSKGQGQEMSQVPGAQIMGSAASPTLRAWDTVKKVNTTHVWRSLTQTSPRLPQNARREGSYVPLWNCELCGVTGWYLVETTPPLEERFGSIHVITWRMSWWVTWVSGVKFYIDSVFNFQNKLERQAEWFDYTFRGSRRRGSRDFFECTLPICLVTSPWWLSPTMLAIVTWTLQDPRAKSHPENSAILTHSSLHLIQKF